jgi:nucleotide-binding universal stress UspA family protein
MSIREILVPIVGREELDSDDSFLAPAVEAAMSLGRRFGSHVEVLSIGAAREVVHRSVPWWVPTSGVREIIDLVGEGHRLQQERARTTFESVIASLDFDVPIAEEPRAGFCASFVAMTGDPDETLSVRGRLADLIVLARAGLQPHYLVDVGLRETGKPVLLMPPHAPEALGQRVALAWNGTVESARALALSMDFLRAAEERTVIVVDEEDAPERSAEPLLRYLAWHGLDAKLVRSRATCSAIAEAIGSAAMNARADLLVMGAHSRNRLREIILGDVTEHVLTETEIAALMVH